MSSSHQAPMSPGHQQIQAHLPKLRAILAATPSEGKKAIADFWRAIRNSILNLEQQLLSQQPPAPQPQSSPAVQDIREGVDRALQEEGLTVYGASDTLEAIWNLDPAWVKALLVKQRNQERNELGCWVSNNTPAHENGYTKLNLRNTRRPGTNDMIGVQPFLHQLAIVAKGAGAALMSTAAGDYEVSHLCHNGRCFNEDHVVVESTQLNKSRQRCVDSYITQCGCGSVWHPCPHGRLEGYNLCILPKRMLERGKYNRCGPDGPVGSA